MSNVDMASNSPENPSGNPIREGLIETAVRFLTNPNVADRPLQQKQSFLKSKGLSDEEIRVCFQRANIHVSVPHQQQDTVIPMYSLPQHAIVSHQPSLWIRMRDILHTLALLGGLGYAIFWVYKTYIEPFLFGRKPKKSTEETLDSIEKAVKGLGHKLKHEMRSEMSRISQERESGSARNLADIKSDIATVKGLLLSRQQFPSAPNSSALRSGQNSKPTIPAWQMSAEQKNGLNDDEEQSSHKDPPGHLPDKPSDPQSMDSSNSKDSIVDKTDIHTLKDGFDSTIITNGGDSSLGMISN